MNDEKREKLLKQAWLDQRDPMSKLMVKRQQRIEEAKAAAAEADLKKKQADETFRRHFTQDPLVEVTLADGYENLELMLGADEDRMDNWRWGLRRSLGQVNAIEVYPIAYYYRAGDWHDLLEDEPVLREALARRRIQVRRLDLTEVMASLALRNSWWRSPRRGRENARTRSRSK